MSHFAVLVIGEDFEKQLAPYHEFECTGIDDEYIQDVDITGEILDRLKQSVFVPSGGTDYKISRDSDHPEEITREELSRRRGDDPLTYALGYHGLDDRMISSEADIDRDKKHKYGYAIVRDGKLIKAVDRTNPNKKWDWYLVGGRWTGYFKLRPGASGEVGEPGTMTPAAKKGYADQALKRDIDFEAMRDAAEEKARERYQAVVGLFDGAIPPFIPWQDYLDESVPGTKGVPIDDKRDMYWAQGTLAKLKGIQKFRSGKRDSHPVDDFYFSLEDYVVTEAEYLLRARNSAITTFAVVKDGKWFERGEMGWFGCVSGEMDKDKWNEEFSRLLDDLPSDTLLTIVDCHI